MGDDVTLRVMWSAAGDKQYFDLDNLDIYEPQDMRKVLLLLRRYHQRHYATVAKLIHKTNLIYLNKILLHGDRFKDEQIHKTINTCWANINTVIKEECCESITPIDVFETDTDRAKQDALDLSKKWEQAFGMTIDKANEMLKKRNVHTKKMPARKQVRPIKKKNA